MPMNVDAIILIVLAIFFLLGFVRGFIKQIGSIVGFFLALWVAAAYHPAVAAYLKPSFSQWQIISQQLSIVCAYILLYFGTQFVFGILVSIADHMFRIFSFAPFMKFTNRFLGGFIGILEGVLLVSAAVYLLTYFPFSEKLTKQLKQSRFLPAINAVNRVLLPLLPDVSKFSQGLPSMLYPKNIDPASLSIDPNSKEYKQLKVYLDQIMKEQGSVEKKTEKQPVKK